MISAKRHARPVSAALACAIGFSLLLLALAVPDDFKDRTADTGRQHASAVKLAPSDEVARHPTLCAKESGPTTANLAEKLRVRLAEHGLTVMGLDVGSAGEAARGGATAVDVRFEASGPYPRAVVLLEDLASSAPILSVDSLDLTTEGALVKLGLSGRLLCTS